MERWLGHISLQSTKYPGKLEKSEVPESKLCTMWRRIASCIDFSGSALANWNWKLQSSSSQVFIREEEKISEGVNLVGVCKRGHMHYCGVLITDHQLVPVHRHSPGPALDSLILGHHIGRYAFVSRKSGPLSFSNNAWLSMLSAHCQTRSMDVRSRSQVPVLPTYPIKNPAFLSDVLTTWMTAPELNRLGGRARELQGISSGYETGATKPIDRGKEKVSREVL
ncbi:hypothetical protein BDW67DRAFT_157583 [Aspergillus spinulosporus]